MRNNLYLIGLMGSGKTTVGRRLSALLRFGFLDTDQELELRTGVSISRIFEVEGEAGFRERESRLFEEVCSHAGHVFSTGGGLILDPENCARMHRYGQVIYLKATIDILWDRLQFCKTRPLLCVDDPRGVLEQLLQIRDPIYSREADLVLHAGQENAAQMARSIIRMLELSDAGSPVGGP